MTKGDKETDILNLDVAPSTFSKRPKLDNATYTMNETASLFGLGYTTVWSAVQEGTFPITPLKFGRQYRFPKVVVDRMLGLNAGADVM